MVPGSTVHVHTSRMSLSNGRFLLLFIRETGYRFLSPTSVSFFSFFARARRKRKGKVTGSGQLVRKKLTAAPSISATKKNTGKKMAEIETFLSDSF